MHRLSAMAVAATLTLSGCSVVGGSTITTGEDGVRTYTVDHGMGCRAGPDAADPNTVLRGTLVSDPSRAVDSVWLATAAGDVHVVWPDVWIFSFGSSGVSVVDKDGYAIAVEGDEVVLQDHRFGEAGGTEPDPYIASGRIGTNCYPRR